MRRALEPRAHRLSVGALLPRGSASVSVGLLVLGLSAYAFLVVSARALGPEKFGALSTLYVLVYAFGPGLFLPLEQEVGRVTAVRTARGEGTAPVLRRAALAGVLVLAPLVIGAATLAPLIADAVFGGQVVLVLALCLALIGIFGTHLTRGLLAGTGQFGAYSAQLGLEGFVRLLGCAVLAVAGVQIAGPYGLLLGAAPLLAVTCTAPRLRGRLSPGPPAPWNELSGALSLLLAASLLSQILVNAGPVAVQLLADDDELGAAGRLLAAFVIARVPLFLFAAVQVTLLPGLARTLGAGDLAGFRADLRRVLLAVGGLALVGLGAVAALGPWSVRLFFGEAFALGRSDLVLLALSTACYMLTVVLQPALLALRRYGSVVFGWALGCIVAVVACVPEDDVLVRVERALTLGTAAALAAMAVLLVRALRDPPGLVEAAALRPPVVL